MSWWQQLLTLSLQRWKLPDLRNPAIGQVLVFLVVPKSLGQLRRHDFAEVAHLLSALILLLAFVCLDAQQLAALLERLVVKEQQAVPVSCERQRNHFRGEFVEALLDVVPFPFRRVGLIRGFPRWVQYQVAGQSPPAIPPLFDMDSCLAPVPAKLPAPTPCCFSMSSMMWRPSNFS